MAFDGLVLNAVSNELACLIGGKLQKIYEPDENEILLSIYCNGLQYALSINISSNLYSVYLTQNKKINPLVAPNFCMLLRKHLINYKISNIYTLGLERILIIDFIGKDENNTSIVKKMVIELMGKYSNILLLDENDIIIDSFKHFSTNNGASRNMLPKHKYSSPSSNKIDISNFEELINNLDDSCIIDFFCNNFIGLSKTSVKQLIAEKNISTSLDNYTLLANYLLELQNNIKNSHIKCISVENNDYALTYSQSIIPLQVNTFLDNYYNNKQENEQFLSYKNTLLSSIVSKLKKLSKKLSNINEKLEECSQMEKYKLYGELITSNLYQISKQRLSHIELLNYYDGTTIDIPLDISLYPNDNAKKYFKKYNKLKATNDIVQIQKIELEKEINYLESIVYEIEVSTCISDIYAISDEVKSSFSLQSKKKQKNRTSPSKSSNNLTLPIKYNINGFNILVGKNNKQNDELTFKVANKDDLWFHVKDFPGSHTILQTNGVTPSQEILNKCAAIAAFYSQASNSSNVPVDYTLIKYVKKIKNSKPGMVIYTNQETINVQPNSFNDFQINSNQIE